mmetsp:Transcript_25640/g.56552  ORF Transcript_25640/g.56552 Transcript_25640/m.56552 type:complete len:212 (-) Transcript_25640:157-792(-)
MTFSRILAVSLVCLAERTAAVAGPAHPKLRAPQAEVNLEAVGSAMEESMESRSSSQWFWQSRRRAYVREAPEPVNPCPPSGASSWAAPTAAVAGVGTPASSPPPVGGVIQTPYGPCRTVPAPMANTPPVGQLPPAWGGQAPMPSNVSAPAPVSSNMTVAQPPAAVAPLSNTSATAPAPAPVPTGNSTVIGLWENEEDMDDMIRVEELLGRE